MADMSRRPVVIEAQGGVYDGRENVRAYEIEGARARLRFREFFRRFCHGNEYPYRDALIRHWNRREFYVEVDLAHVNEFDDVLLQALQVWFRSLSGQKSVSFSAPIVVFYSVFLALNL